jgi:hypothetical protein
MRTILFAAALAICAGSVSAADSASGNFRSKDVDLPLKSALAFRGTSMIDKQPVIVVGVTNGDMIIEAMTLYHDRRRAMEQRVKDQGTGVVYFEFKPDGAYRGYSFHFASGNGCGFCGGNMGIANDVKLANGKLVGTLKGTDTDRSFDIRLDVPVQSDDHGSPLPANGGDPGRAYLAYHDALVKRDAKALRVVMSDEMRTQLDQAAKDGKARGYMDFLAQEHPTQKVTVGRGWSNGKAAVLLFDGESSVLKLRGEAVLLNQGGTWRVDDELTDVVLR